METTSNPFLNVDVFAPTEFREYFQRYSLTAGGSSVEDYDRKPFHRMVDFWFMGIAVAVKRGLRPANLDGLATYKPIEGAAIASLEWRIHALKLIAIAESDDPGIVTDGRAMMKIANGLAFAGMPVLIELLERNPDEESLALCDELVEMLG
ncbi:hypothetical protein G6L05_21580 [Agrobacterium rhizogenes]|nr:hypothetical protein [Rhizobium rhizogenes]